VVGGFGHLPSGGCNARGRRPSSDPTSPRSFLNDPPVAYGEFVEDKDDLQKVLRALTSKDHPNCVDPEPNDRRATATRVHSILSQGIALELAKAFDTRSTWKSAQSPFDLARSLRNVVDVEVGAIPPPGPKR
jgi:hypothetical protein